MSPALAPTPAASKSEPTSNALWQTLLAMPDLPDVERRLSAHLAEERRRREVFIADLRDDMKAEFINGEVIAHSPARYRHSRVSANLERVVDTYLLLRGGGILCQEKTLFQTTRNAYEPDLCFFGPAKAALVKPDDWRFPVPDWCVEVLSETTEHRDRGVKFQDYAAHGVQEYWLVDTVEQTLEQYRAEAGAYQLHALHRELDATLAPLVLPECLMPLRALFDAQAALHAAAAFSR